jgi:hypothetical protein
MNNEIIKELCEAAFDIYPQELSDEYGSWKQDDTEWGEWFTDRYPNSTIVSVGPTQAAIIRTDSKQTVVFRGTEPSKVKDLQADMNILGFDLGSRRGEVHSGFYHYTHNVSASLLEGLSPDLPVYITGHSLGAAAATIFAEYLYWHDDYSPVGIGGIVVFGSPRVGNTVFRDRMNGIFRGRSLRVENNNDIVTRIPLPMPISLTGKFPHYRHCFDALYFNRKGKVIPISRNAHKFCTWVRRTWDRILGYRFGDFIGEHSEYRERVAQLK